MRAIGGLFLLVSASLLAEDTGFLNREMPQWLRLGAQMRLRSEGEHGISYVEGNDRDFLLQRYRLSWSLSQRLPDGFARGYAYGAFAGICATFVAAFLGDWVLPFVYIVGLAGFRASIMLWIFLGGLMALDQMCLKSSPLQDSDMA